jgi:hypothetical protein
MTGKLIALVDASDHARSVCDDAAWAAAASTMSSDPPSSGVSR